MGKVYAIVVTYNAMPWIDRCLTSLMASSIPIQILVVDNCSSDATRNHIKADYPNVQLFESATNLGFGKGNNVGLEIALKVKADFVLLLNQDAWIERDCIQRLITVFGKEEEYGVLSPVHLEGDGEKMERHFSTYVSPEYCEDFISDSYLNKYKQVYESRFVNAACWLIKSETLRKVGGFDPIFSHYGEDEDYVNRLQYQGYKIGVVPDARVFHDISYKSWDEIFWNKERQKIFAYIRLKNINTTLKSAIFIYTKEMFDAFTTNIFIRRIRKGFYQLHIIFLVIKDLRKIHQSRKTSRKICPYLND